jgi:class 3 adenylate cyclase
LRNRPATGFFALLGAPVAHEDHPQRAVRAALGAPDDLRRRGEDLRKQRGAGVEIRIGINTEMLCLICKSENSNAACPPFA